VTGSQHPEPPAAGPSAPAYALLSVATAVVTITLKLLAWKLTGSVGLLSDAMESFVIFSRRSWRSGP